MTWLMRRHVDAARGDVGGDQDAQLARAQAVAATRLRRPCGMPPCSEATRVAHARQAVGEPVGVALACS